MDKVYDRRITELNGMPVDYNGDCVIYWMQRSQRATDNFALNFSIRLANDLGKPVLVYFGIFEKYPMASARAFQFMLEGLQETSRILEERGIGFLVRQEHPQEGILRAAREFRASAVIVDEDYLKIGQSWREYVASRLDVRFIQVDAETVVPVRLSGKEEWGAYTLRPKIKHALKDYFVDVPDATVNKKWTSNLEENIDIRNINTSAFSSLLDVDQNVPPTPYYKGGATEANERLLKFIQTNLPRYAYESNEIGTIATSELSPYFHFGQISTLRAALTIDAADAPAECIDAYLEQLIVRRELSINFCFYNKNYDNISSAPNWARNTLEIHRHDVRPELYSLEELECAKTHDELWNASQIELVKYGRIHSYMRMVWAKMIFQWSPTPEEALDRCIYLNDKYALDGRDPNGYANIAWSIFGKADRPFKERPIFGKIRYMSTASTKRKYDWQGYVKRVLAGS